MDKENIYEYMLEQKHFVELECLKVNTQCQTDNIFPDNIISLSEQLGKEIEATSKQINEIKTSLREKEKEKDLLRLEKEKESNKSNQSNKSNMFITFDDIINMISALPDGVYGIINYYAKQQSADKIIKFISDKKLEYYNKPAIVKKLIEKGKFTETAINEAYGFVFMYEKKDDDIIDLNKVYLLKNGDIENINQNLSESVNDSGEDNEEQDKIITKIYNFVSDKKIALKEIIYESNFQSAEEEEEVDETLPCNNLLKLEDKLSDMESKKKEYETFLKAVKKYKKYLNDNVKSDDIKDTLNNFTSIKTLIKKISDPTKHILDISTFVKHNWTNKFTNVKFSNRYDEAEYNNLISKYFDDTVMGIVNNLLDIYDINKLFKPHMYVFVELLLRAYIDEYLKNQSYCLSKEICSYLNLPSVMSEPDTQTLTLKKRYWTNALESLDSKRIVTSLLNIVNSKTQTLDQTLKYLASLDISVLGNNK